MSCIICNALYFTPLSVYVYMYCKHNSDSICDIGPSSLHYIEFCGIIHAQATEIFELLIFKIILFFVGV